jgi:hypothetical protein
MADITGNSKMQPRLINVGIAGVPQWMTLREYVKRKNAAREKFPTMSDEDKQKWQQLHNELVNDIPAIVKEAMSIVKEVNLI